MTLDNPNGHPSRRVSSCYGLYGHSGRQIRSWNYKPIRVYSVERRHSGSALPSVRRRYQYPRKYLRSTTRNSFLPLAIPCPVRVRLRVQRAYIKCLGCMQSDATHALIASRFSIRLQPPRVRWGNVSVVLWVWRLRNCNRMHSAKSQGAKRSQPLSHPWVPQRVDQG